MTRGSHFQTHNEHFCTSVKSHYIRMYSRFVVLRRAHKECEMWKQMLQDWGEEDCLICMTATGKLNIESELLALNACSWAFQIAVTYLKESHFNAWVTRTSSHSSCLSPFRSDPRSDPEPGRTSEPGGSNTWTRPGSGSWIIRRLARLPLTSNHQAPESKSTVQCTEHWLSFRTKQQSFAKHFPLTQKSYLVRKRIGHYRFAALYIEGFYPRSSPLLFI